MKTILEFTLPEDEYEYENARDGKKFRLALEAITQKLRALRKYGEVGETTWTEVEQLVWALIREEGISEL